MSNNLTISLLIIFSIDLFLFLGQISIANLGGYTNFYDYESSNLKDFDKGDYTLDLDSSTDYLPDSENSVTEEGNIFTDSFKTAKKWLSTTGKGLKYLLSFLSGPTMFLSSIGAPSAFTFGLGALWYGTTLFLLISFIIGR